MRLVVGSRRRRRAQELCFFFVSSSCLCTSRLLQLTGELNQTEKVFEERTWIVLQCMRNVFISGGRNHNYARNGRKIIKKMNILIIIHSCNKIHQFERLNKQKIEFGRKRLCAHWKKINFSYVSIQPEPLESERGLQTWIECNKINFDRPQYLFRPLTCKWVVKSIFSFLWQFFKTPS